MPDKRLAYGCVGADQPEAQPFIDEVDGVLHWRSSTPHGRGNEGLAMQVRLRHLRKLRRDEYRMTLDLIDAERGPWDQGDCVVQIDLLDAPGQHASSARGLLKPALELYRLVPGEPPTTLE